MKKGNILILFSVFVLLFSAFPFAQNHISVSVIANGGGMQSNVHYSITGTAGQSATGKSISGVNQVMGGFWQEYQALTPVEDEEILPTIYKLEQNYPNPFNPSTVVKFAVPERCNVIIKIYDLLGSEVVTLVNKELNAGWYEKTFNAGGYSSGIYFCRMQTGRYVNTKKMLLIK